MKTRIWANLCGRFSNDLSRRLTQFTDLTYLTCLGLLALPLAGCLQESAGSPAETVTAATEPSTQSQTSDMPAETSADTDADEALAQADEQSISNAPVKRVSTEIQVPANLKPSPATAEIIKLANAGVEQNVMLSFVTNSLGTFNLRAEEIIYLNDIGIPSVVIAAMIQRDHLLQGTPSNLTMTPGETEPSMETPPSPVYTPDVGQGEAPQPDYASDNYTMPAESEPSATEADNSDYYDSLAPYGSWVDVDGVGRCWQPTVVVVNPGWQPYLNCGRWVYTDCGWYWMSDYSWGWAPFHYGRWFQHGKLGWCWCPGRVWAPAWVCWRQSGDFCGWAPLPPGARFVAGVGMTFRGRPVRPNFSFGLTANRFQFIHTGHFLNRDLARNVVPRDQSGRIFEHSIASTGIVDHNHRISNAGIPREQVALAVHRNIIPATLRNVTPAEGVGVRDRFERNGRTLAIFRPDAQPRISSRTPAVSRGDQPQSNPSVLRQNVQRNERLATIQPGVPQIAQPAMGNSARGQVPLRTGQPLVVRGFDSPRQTAIAPAPNPQNTRRSVPLNSVVVIGQNRDSRVALAQTDTRSSWNSQNRPSPNYNRDFRTGTSQPLARNDDPPSGVDQRQTRQADWWAHPQQPRNPGQEQFRHNREMPVRGAGSWNAVMEQPRYSPTPVQAPQHNRSAPIETHQSRPAQFESQPMRSVPMESHQSRSVPVETRQSQPAPQVSQQSHSAPAPAPAVSQPSHSAPAATSSSSSSSSSQSSGRGR